MSGTICCWNLQHYEKVGDLSSAKKLFADIPERDVVACNAMISALGMHGYVKEVRELFDQMREKTSSSWNTMISCYCKLGDVESARMIFDSNPVKNVISWNAMIDGYSENAKPTIETTVSLLSACAHLGALDMGYWIHGYIRRQKLKADVYLGNAFVDNASPDRE
ncbi:hypothetical protein IFM89_011099 [Coptis chinensis]|uniref:Pentatricopeptide repeat-containing protein n=1 Tax=Coptis chinensis TaxID=261450 RepID=A0A835MAZ8_9MAGN|nr:hypothetical protein IFM89_011099 [Coptis chinensis]